MPNNFFRFRPKHRFEAVFVTRVVASFVGMIIALSWNNILKHLIDLLKENYPILSLLGGAVGALLVTVITLQIAILFVRNYEVDSSGNPLEQTEE